MTDATSRLVLAASLESFPAFLRMELKIIVKTPLVMIMGLGR